MVLWIFFEEKNITIEDTKKLSKDVAVTSSALGADELAGYQKYEVYYVKENVVYESGNGINNDEICDTGTNFRNYVLVMENGKWKIARISSPNIKGIVKENEGYDDVEEAEMMKNQQEREEAEYSQMANEENDGIACAALSYPSTIKVYFTNQKNRNYYGSKQTYVNFHVYLKNVIPCEWIVSNFASYPAYLKAGAMASKTYGWYHTIYPKWNYSPYNANVKDNTDDQVFVYNAYSSMAEMYREYEEKALSAISGKVMVLAGTSNVFEAQFNATLGSKNSGVLSESKCLELAKQGYTYSKILHYFYDYSSNTGNKAIEIKEY